MALGKYTRIDNNRRSSSTYCSTVTIVVFVALCLVGIWMMTSSSVVPVQNADDPAQENKTEVKEQTDNVSTNSNTQQQFEDNPGDLPDDATKGDANTTDANAVSQDNNEKANKSDDGASKTEDGLSDSNNGGAKTDTDQPVRGEGDSEDNSTKNKTAADGGDNKAASDGSEETVDDGFVDKKYGSDDSGSKSGDNNSSQTNQVVVGQVEQNSSNIGTEKSSDEEKDESSKQVFPSAALPELLNETVAESGSFATQATESKNEKEAHLSDQVQNGFKWKLCNSTAGPDYIPCLDNLQAIKNLRTTKHYEHRERHCPQPPPTCLVPLPEGYKHSIEWPKSREKIWFSNVPHTKLVEIKGHQNWVKVAGEYLTFPGGGTQFKRGALHYIDFIQESVPEIAWGKRSRVVLDVGCGVASFGGFLFDRNVLTMSIAPKDEHEAQVQFALERGIPAVSAVMGTQRLPFPGKVFDVVHCARCRVPWHIEGGKLLLELNRVLRPGGFFVWSATPVYQHHADDIEIWEAMSKLTQAMCWKLVNKTSRDSYNNVAVAVYKKPTSNECYEQRSQQEPPLCKQSDDPNAAWSVPLQDCMHEVPVDASERGSQWPEQWPERLQKSPYWLLSSQVGVYGKAAPEDFTADDEHWKQVVSKSYLKGLGINWSSMRNVMDMRAVYGGFAAALKDLNVWVMNIVPIDSPDTLPIIYERGLFGIYHDWCESFNTYPRSYDLLHADHLFSKVKKRCNLEAVIAEVDRMLRPDGNLVVRDNVETISEVENLVKSMHWEVCTSYSKDKEGLLSVRKTFWRPQEVETLTYALA